MRRPKQQSGLVPGFSRNSGNASATYGDAQPSRGALAEAVLRQYEAA